MHHLSLKPYYPQIKVAKPSARQAEDSNRLEDEDQPDLNDKDDYDLESEGDQFANMQRAHF